MLLLPVETPLAVRRQQLVRALQVSSRKGRDVKRRKEPTWPIPYFKHQILGFIYASEPLLTFVYIRHMTRLASNGVRNLKASSA